jgi:hypothetical protein
VAERFIPPSARMLARRVGCSTRYVYLEVRAGRLGRGAVLHIATVDLAARGSWARAVRRLARAARKTHDLILDQSLYIGAELWESLPYPGRVKGVLH